MLGYPTAPCRECWRQIEAKPVAAGVRQVIFRRVGNLVGIPRIARQHRNGAQKLRAFCFGNEKPLGFAQAAVLARRGANDPFAHERTAGCARIRSLVGALETNSGMKLAADWIASRSLSSGR